MSMDTSETVLLQIRRIYGDGRHNAFTDLLFWKGHYYLGFRTAEQHGLLPNGDVLVLRSRDLHTWEPCARFDTGGDDRDPKLVNAGDRLAVMFGTWVPRWGDGTRSIPGLSHDMISHVALSRDGLCWSVPRQVHGVNYWLWRTLATEEGYWCAAYHFPVRQDRDRRSIHLLHSPDLLNWTLRSVMKVGGGCGEAALYRPAPNTLHCILRAEGGTDHSWFGMSVEPYTEWTWHDLGVMIHAPVVLPIAGRWIVAGRSRAEDLPAEVRPSDSGHHTSVWEIGDRSATHLLTVPSAGDCSYPGLAIGPDGEAVMSYYSQHERMPLPEGMPVPADIFIAHFRVPLDS